MAFKDQHNPSIIIKMLLSASMFMGILIPALLMTGNADFLLQFSFFNKIEGNIYRQILIISLSIIYLIRFVIGMFVFLKRKIGWFEGCLTSFLFFMMFFLFNSSAGNHFEPLMLIDIIGIILYLVGSYINSLSDYQRYVWKEKPNNKGRLYTEGLFKYSMHINYFGDSILYIGLAMITLEYVCLFVALGIILNFIFLQIPMLDKHLSNKYSIEFEEYDKQTKRFIPFVY